MDQRVTSGSLVKWRSEAIRRMERSRQSTLRFLEQVPEAEVLRRRTQGKWSFKDVLAHIAAWEEEGARRLTLIARGRGDQVVFYNDMRLVDRFNARAVGAARRLSLAALYQRLARSRRNLIDALRKVPSAALNDPSHEYPVVAWLPEFAWTHEQHHLQRIQTWWRERRKSLRDT